METSLCRHTGRGQKHQAADGGEQHLSDKRTHHVETAITTSTGNQSLRMFPEVSPKKNQSGREIKSFSESVGLLVSSSV